MEGTKKEEKIGMVEEPRIEKPKKERISWILCQSCQKKMKRTSIRPYNTNTGIAMMLIGIVLMFTGLFSVIGFPLILLGLFFTISKRKVWLCKSCGTVVERFESN